MKNDNVNHPKHYVNSAAKCPMCNALIECIDITRHQSFNIGNAIKYLWRYKDKNGAEDLQKAVWYINDEIKKMNCLDIPEKVEIKVYPGGISLDDPKNVMEAFLYGHKLINSEYFDLTGETYLYLNKASGYICEEDGSAAKPHRVPICMRDDNVWWKVLE